MSLVRNMLINYCETNPLQGAWISSLRASTEESTLLVFIAEAFYLDAPPPNTVFVSSKDRTEMLDSISNLAISFGFDSWRNIAFSGSPDLEEIIRNRLHRTMSDVRQLKQGGLLFMRALAQNSSAIMRCGSWWIDRPPSDHYAVVCGAGPSLKREINTLHAIQDYVYIICVGRAYQTLIDAGIVPDLVCEIDVMAHVNWDKHDPLIGVPLLCPPTLSPFVVKQFRHVLFTTNAGDVARCLEDLKLSLPAVYPGRSVAMYALEAALSLFWFKRVALLGVDLCYPDKGPSHVDARDGEAGPQDSLCFVPGRDGNEVVTDGLFAQMREEIEAHILLAVRHGRVSNCSVGGALIHYADNQTLSEFGKEAPCLPKNPIEKLIMSSSRSDIPPVAYTLARAFQPLVARHIGWLAQESPAGLTGELQDLYSDLKEELEFDLHYPRYRSVYHCFFYLSLVRYAMKFIGKQNPELAELLKSEDWADSGVKFLTRPRLMQVPYLEAKPDGDVSIPLSSRNDMEYQAAKECEEWISRADFDPARQVVVFLAPGNYMHVVEMARRFPTMRAIVIEPWLENLYNLAVGCQVFHLLPPDTVFIGIDPKLNWKDLLSREFHKTRQGDTHLEFFINPRTWGSPDVKKLWPHVSLACLLEFSLLPTSKSPAIVY